MWAYTYTWIIWLRVSVAIVVASTITTVVVTVTTAAVIRLIVTTVVILLIVTATIIWLIIIIIILLLAVIDCFCFSDIEYKSNSENGADSSEGDQKFLHRYKEKEGEGLYAFGSITSMMRRNTFKYLQVFKSLYQDNPA